MANLETIRSHGYEVKQFAELENYLFFASEINTSLTHSYFEHFKENN